MIYIRAKREREREPLDVEDETTQTSSPGGWQGRLSAFLHVHRGSRASSRKSSRASDASDISELGGPWLNLPLLLLSSAANVAPEELDLGRDSNDVSIKVSEATPEATSPMTPSVSVPPTGRRRSIYNFPFFLKHQDAVETPDETASPPCIKKGGMKTSGTTHSLHPATAEDPKPKRGSIIRRRPSTKLRRSGSILSPAQPEPVTGSDVSILVTEASPEASSPTAAAVKPAQLCKQQSEVVHVLVHRESEEYNMDESAETAEVIIVPERPPRSCDAPSISGGGGSGGGGNSSVGGECVITIEPDCDSLNGRSRQDS